MDASIIEFYRKINNTDGLSKNEVIINTAKKNVLSGFDDCGRYFKCKVNGLDKELLVYGSSNSTVLNEKMNVITKPNEYLLIGDLVEWDSLNWLVTELDADDSIYCQGKILQCNNVIKFYDKTSISNAIITTPCVVTSASKVTLDENKYITNLDGNLVVKVPLNKNTLTIYEGQRFILGRKVFIVTGFVETECDFVKNTGVLAINMEVTETNPLKDDFAKGIAYNEKDVINNYAINILNGSSISLSINQTVNINTQITNNGTVITPTPELTYTSSDVTKCTVSDSGLITGLSEGNCIITVALKSEPAIKSIINVIVSIVIIDKLSIQFINPVNQIKLGKSQNFECKVLNSGIEVSKNVVFNIRNDNTSTNVYATIESTSGTNCVVKATTNTNYRNKYFYLKCSLVEDGSVFVEIMVKVASLV